MVQPFIDSCVDQILEILKRDDVKNKCKVLYKPIIDYIVTQLTPYLICIGIFVLLLLIILILILFILLRGPCVVWGFTGGGITTHPL